MCIPPLAVVHQMLKILHFQEQRSPFQEERSHESPIFQHKLEPHIHQLDLQEAEQQYTDKNKFSNSGMNDNIDA